MSNASSVFCDRREAVLASKHAVVIEHGDVRQDAHAKADRDSGLNAGKIRARIGDALSTASGLKCVNGAIAKETALLKHGERYGIAAQVD